MTWPSATSGFIAIEWVAAIAMLLLPAVVLVATLPTWAERRHAATVAAREAARDLQQRWPAADVGEPSSWLSTSPPTTGSTRRDVSVRVLTVGVNPGDQIRVEVRVRDAGDRGARPRAGRRVDVLDGRVGARRRLPESVMRGSRRGRDQHGMITLWILGLTISVMFLGGLGLDLWRAIAVRREVSVMADAAATAGANGLDENALRGGELQLDDARVRQLVAAELAEYPNARRLDGES